MLDFDKAVNIVRDEWDKAQWLFKATAPFGDQFALVYFDDHDRETLLSGLITESQHEPVFYDALKNISAALILYEKPLPAALRTWLADHLTGKVTRPGRRGRDGYKNLFRDHMIPLYVKRLTDRGMKKTRNTGSDHTSACDAVAEAVNMSYEGVVSVMNK